MSNEKNNNQIGDLYDMLFEQMKRLNDTSANLEVETKRANAMVSVGNVIVNAAKVEVEHVKHTKQLGTSLIPEHKMLNDGSDTE